MFSIYIFFLFNILANNSYVKSKNIIGIQLLLVLNSVPIICYDYHKLLHDDGLPCVALAKIGVNLLYILNSRN